MRSLGSLCDGRLQRQHVWEHILEMVDVGDADLCSLQEVLRARELSLLCVERLLVDACQTLAIFHELQISLTIKIFEHRADKIETNFTFVL